MRKTLIAAVAASLAVGAAAVGALVGGPSAAGAADHVDAPGLMPPGGNFQLDITDIYAWRAKTGNTVLALNVNGLAKPGQAPVFASGVPGVRSTKGVAYWLRTDNDGDAVSDVDLQVTFGKPAKNGVQHLTVRRNGKLLVSGKSTAPGARIVKVNRQNGVKAYAGLRDDPFFFDLAGYLDILAALDDDMSNDAKSFVGCTSPRSDFFKGLNVSSIVLELPPGLLTGSTSSIGVWGATTVGGKQVDRMGRPAINTVFLPNNPFPGEQKGQVPSQKSAFNKAQPRNDQAAFRGEVVNTLQVLFGLNDTAGDDKSDDAKQISGLADVLLPDVLTFDTAKPGPFLNGRGLADDVIDAELGLITEGTVKTDCVSKNDRKFWPNFPYLATPHA
ncbi:MAG TPA: DUF4331 family protein [Gaiella sp.]|nr:DUF4331 family protein [Gaiella sp.]